MIHTRGFLITAITNKMFADFDQLYKQYEDLMGVPVYTHQLSIALHVTKKLLPGIIERQGYSLDEFKAIELDRSVEWTFQALVDRYDLNKEFVVDYTDADLRDIREQFQGDDPNSVIKDTERIIVEL